MHTQTRGAAEVRAVAENNKSCRQCKQGSWTGEGTQAKKSRKRVQSPIFAPGVKTARTQGDERESRETPCGTRRGLTSLYISTKDVPINSKQ